MWTLAIVVGGFPLIWAAWADRRTALAYAYVWAGAAWLAWLGSAASGVIAARYLALCLTGCAGIAVLGARRPGSAAWNAVVLGLLCVLLLPLAQRLLTNVDLPVEPIRLGFLGLSIAVGLVNYIPTRRGLGATALLAASLIELRRIDSDSSQADRAWTLGLAAAAPWLATIPLRLRARRATEDRAWRDFRDRFGAVWALRLRDQFNRAAEHAGLGVQLSWRGLRQVEGSAPSPADRAASQELLAALMTRFQ